MSEIHTKADRMAGIFFAKPERSNRGMVLVQIQDRGGKLMARKWNYTTKKWGKWGSL